jgi:hypothetical protein
VSTAPYRGRVRPDIGTVSWFASLLVWLLPCVLTAASSAGAGSEGSVSARARELLRVTPAAERPKLQQPFTDEARSDWHYIPRQRTGVAWRDMNAAQRTATTELLRSVLSDGGLSQVRDIMALEIALRKLETLGRSRDPENYALALFGAPGPGGFWGFRIEGHHLSLHFTLTGDRVVSSLPQFMGANPALVPRDFEPDGPRGGSRVLGKPEDLARRFMAALPAAQRRAAVFDTRPYGDIVSGNAAQLEPVAPVGVEWKGLAPEHQALLLELLVSFAEHLRADLAEARLARVRAAGLDSLRFGWAGSLEPGKPYYFRIQGASFLIEFDNSGGNHIHSVWRDYQGDFGRDVLRDHYARAKGSDHSH